MSLLKCPNCGEMFSDSYKECPFCMDDEELYREGKVRSHGRRVERPKSPKIAGPAMLVVVLMLVAFLGYTFLGDNIAALFKGEEKPPVVDPSGDLTDDPVVKDPVTLTLDQTTLALKAGESATLTAAGTDSVKWTSSNTDVATVDNAGKITAVSAGSATITVSAENAKSAVCVLTVTPGEQKLSIQSRWGLTGQFSIDPGDSAQIVVVDEETDEFVENVQWSTEDSSIATVDDEGYVTGVSSGTTDVIATVNGQTLTIEALVR